MLLPLIPLSRLSLLTVVPLRAAIRLRVSPFLTVVLLLPLLRLRLERAEERLLPLLLE